MQAMVGGGALGETHRHRDGHAMVGGDVLVDCGALSYEVKGAGLV